MIARMPFLIALLLMSGPVSAQDTANDPAGPPKLRRIAPQTQHELQELFQPTGKPLPFVSAHRGGARKGFPENCIATFEDTLRHTFAIIELKGNCF